MYHSESPYNVEEGIMHPIRPVIRGLARELPPVLLGAGNRASSIARFSSHRMRVTSREYRSYSGVDIGAVPGRAGTEGVTATGVLRCRTFKSSTYLKYLVLRRNIAH